MGKTAFLFVSDISDIAGFAAFAQSLVEKHGYALFGDDGVAGLLEPRGLNVTRVSLEVSVGNEWLMEQGVDLIAVHFPPFERISQDVFADPRVIMQQVDINGPRLLRRAAKCSHEITVICDPSDYERVQESLENGDTLRSLRGELAAKVFQKTAQYDLAVATFLENRSEAPDLDVLSGFGKHCRVDLKQAARLPHGENPHQQAALYGGFFDCLKQLQGEPLAYSHCLSVSAAMYLMGEFEKAAVAIIKHSTPCGVASADTLEDAWSRALATDKAGARGGVVIVNRTLDGDLADDMKSIPLEVIVSPHFTEEALAILREQKNLRLLVVQDMLGAESLREVRSVVGGVLVQDRDKARPSPSQWTVVSACQPSSDAWEALAFGWKVAKHVKSSAAVIARGEETVEIASGHTTGAGAVNGACLAAEHAGKSLEGAVLVLDDVLEVPDVLVVAKKMGICAILQPGGAPEDAAVIHAANEAGIAMVFTRTKHLKY